jgi:peptidoglycan/LPS O-acetylase OafA/YrhL
VFATKQGMSASPPLPLGRRPALDGLRGVAILLVIAAHTGLLANGYIGVDIFFALSGFLISSLLYEEWERTGGISFRRFYGRRARRLLPALVLVVAVFALVAALFDPFSDLWPLGKLVASTLLFANNWVTAFGNQHSLGPLAPTWSLAQEEQFYLLWPLALWILLRLRVPPAVVLGLLLLAIVGLLQAVPHVRHALPSYSDYFSPLDRAAELLLGCAAAVLWRIRRVPWPLRWRPTGWLLLGGLGFILLGPDMPRRWAYLGAAILAAPLLVNLLPARDDLLVRILSSRPLRYTGTISYGLYLSHVFIDHLLTHYLPGHAPLVYAALTLVCSFAAAGASWHFMESRILARAARSERRSASRSGASRRAAWALEG